VKKREHRDRPKITIGGGDKSGGGKIAKCKKISVGHAFCIGRILFVYRNIRYYWMQAFPLS
jgi:hypothetical protein